MNSRILVQAILTVVVSMGWIAVGTILLRRGASPIGLQQLPMPSFARRAFIGTCFLLLMVATACVDMLKQGLTPARIGQVLLLRDFGGDISWNGRLVFYGYLFLLLVISAHLFPRVFDKTNRVLEGVPPGKPVNVSAEWKQRCDQFRTRNQRWLIAALAWLTAGGALAAGAFLGILPIDAYLYAAVLLLTGIVVFGVASLFVPTRLVCPNCGCIPLRHADKLHRWLDEIEVCELCRARLA